MSIEIHQEFNWFFPPIPEISTLIAFLISKKSSQGTLRNDLQRLLKKIFHKYLKKESIKVNRLVIFLKTSNKICSETSRIFSRIFHEFYTDFCRNFPMDSFMDFHRYKINYKISSKDSFRNLKLKKTSRSSP